MGWKMKSKATTARKRCWETSGALQGARDWGLCLASDARGSYAVAGCRGGDLKLWRPPKAEVNGMNRWVEVAVAERSHASSRMRRCGGGLRRRVLGAGLASKPG